MKFTAEDLDQSEQKTRHLGVLFVAGGDGGNRTRVRKIRPPEIYARSGLKMSLQGTQPTKLSCGHPLRPESPLSQR
jgi:hypothetical protein